MPRNWRTITGSTSRLEIPPIVWEPLIHRTRPETNVAVPSVITSDSRPSSTTIAPLTTPTAAPATRPATIAHPTGHPCWTLSTATTIAALEEAMHRARPAGNNLAVIHALGCL